MAAAALAALEEIEHVNCDHLTAAETGALMERVNALFEEISKHRSHFDQDKVSSVLPNRFSVICATPLSPLDVLPVRPPDKNVSETSQQCQKSRPTSLDFAQATSSSNGRSVLFTEFPDAAMRGGGPPSTAIISPPMTYHQIRQNQQTHIDQILASTPPLDPQLREKLSLHVAETRLDALMDKLDSLDEYWKVHFKWKKRISKLEVDRAVKSGTLTRPSISNSNHGTHGRAHLLGAGNISHRGSPSRPRLDLNINFSTIHTSNQGQGNYSLDTPAPTPALGTTRRSASLAFGGLATHDSLLYARSEEDVQRIIQHISDSHEERINRLSANIPDLIVDVSERRERAQKLQQNYAPHEVNEILEYEFGTLAFPYWCCSRRLLNPVVDLSTNSHSCPWTPEEEAKFLCGFMEHFKDFAKIAHMIGTKSHGQVVSFYYLNKHRLHLKKVYKRYRRLKKEKGSFQILGVAPAGNFGSIGTRWTSAEVEAIKEALAQHGPDNLALLAKAIGTAKTPENVRAWMGVHKDLVAQISSKFSNQHSVTNSGTKSSEFSNQPSSAQLASQLTVKHSDLQHSQTPQSLSTNRKKRRREEVPLTLVPDNQIDWSTGRGLRRRAPTSYAEDMDLEDDLPSSVPALIDGNGPIPHAMLPGISSTNQPAVTSPSSHLQRDQPKLEEKAPLSSLEQVSEHDPEKSSVFLSNSTSIVRQDNLIHDVHLVTPPRLEDVPTLPPINAALGISHLAPHGHDSLSSQSAPDSYHLASLGPTSAFGRLYPVSGQQLPPFYPYPPPFYYQASAGLPRPPPTNFLYPSISAPIVRQQIIPISGSSSKQVSGSQEQSKSPIHPPYR